MDKLFSTKIGGLFSKPLAAQTDTASAGTGGYATASSNGGAVAVGDINSGGNAGNAIGVGDTSGVGVGRWRGRVQFDVGRHHRRRRHGDRRRLRGLLQYRVRQLM